VARFQPRRGPLHVPCCSMYRALGPRRATLTKSFSWASISGSRDARSSASCEKANGARGSSWARATATTIRQK
jgi:hypothetical protein